MHVHKAAATSFVLQFVALSTEYILFFITCQCSQIYTRRRRKRKRKDSISDSHPLHINPLMANNLVFVITIALLYLPGTANSTTFSLINKCDYTVWPGILSNAGIAELETTGFALKKGESRTINPPTAWGGRLWGRTHCSTSKSSDEFTCLTGDCGSGTLECAGRNAAPPATLAEFTLSGSGGQDFFDVSLVDGYNLPMLVSPRGGSGENCSATGCSADLNGECPSELRVSSEEEEEGRKGIACRSACEAFGEDEYCCSGAYGSPDTCKPSSYSEVFKKACPLAYSYAYDDKTSTFVCADSPDYTITFCPLPATSQKAASSEGIPPASSSSSSTSDDGGGVPFLLNSSMVYQGALDVSNAPSTTLNLGFITSIFMLWILHHHHLF